MQRLLITGADGFTGRHLTAIATQAGFSVFELSADLTDTVAVFGEVSAINPTHVVHLAAISSVTHADQEAFYRVNLFGSLNLLDSLKALPTKPEKIMLASSANVYGNVDVGIIAESVCPQPVNHYAISKLAMEYMAATYMEDLPIIVTRPFNYTGVGHDNRFVIPKIVEHFKNGAPSIELGNLDVYREYNDVRMVCDAYLKLLNCGISGETYNVCSGNTISLREVISIAEKIVDKKIDVKVNPSFVRPNEVHKLSGNPEKLKAIVGDLQTFSLKDTLKWMLCSDY